MGDGNRGQPVVLVTGVAGYWGARVASRLATHGNTHVIGLDAEQPAGQRDGLDFVLADVRNPLLVELLQAERVDTVCHLAFVQSIWRSESAFDANVMGVTKLLGACAEAGVRKVVLKSSTAVYGARPTNSALLSEGQPLRGSRRYGYTRSHRWMLLFSFTMSTPTLPATRSWPPSTTNASGPRRGRQSTPGWQLSRASTRKPCPAYSRCPNTGLAWPGRLSSSKSRPPTCSSEGRWPTSTATTMSSTLSSWPLLFLAGITPRFDWQPLVVVILVAAAILLVFGLCNLSTLPIQ